MLCILNSRRLTVELTPCGRAAGDGVAGGTDNACQFAVPPGRSQSPRSLWWWVVTVGWGRAGLWRGGGRPDTEAQPGATWPAGRGRRWRCWQRADGCSSRGGHGGGRARLWRVRERDGERELTAHHSGFNEWVGWRFGRLLWQMLGWCELVTYLHRSPEFLARVRVVSGILLVQVAVVFRGPVWRALQRLLGVWGLAVSSIAGPGLGVRQATVARTEFQAGAASVNGRSVRGAERRGVLHLQGAQVLWGASLVMVNHLRHHQRCTVYRS